MIFHHSDHLNARNDYTKTESSQMEVYGVIKWRVIKSLIFYSGPIVLPPWQSGDTGILPCRFSHSAGEYRCKAKACTPLLNSSDRSAYIHWWRFTRESSLKDWHTTVSLKCEFVADPPCMWLSFSIFRTVGVRFFSIFEWIIDSVIDRCSIFDALFYLYLITM